MLYADDERILVSAPNRAGENFIRTLRAKQLPFAALVSSSRQQKSMESLGVKPIIYVDTTKHDSWIIPDYPIGKVFIFEDSLPLCCRYIQICRGWTSKAMYVISHRGNPRMVYRGLGANHVVFANSEDVSYLIEA
ncbi:hypothetical protein [Paenibacillus arenilitoris]|uniref:Uncharacterized protein n=1 Tax=Paenibacillus arenilitoris TaxID=2772299 RepID=A0A927CLE6_9BACL|nr:hypothetical protein [Paenibacillus arenilitoris]MBD2870238.1 hypothetical protein [Paenibacillus arenilitoris]